MAMRSAPSSARPEALDAALASVLGQLSHRLGAAPAEQLHVLDCGGGSGRRAVPLALAGAQVTVLDVSIDALAILARRAAEAGVADRVRAVQADLDDLPGFAELIGAGAFDLVLVHDVLDSTTDPAAVVTTAARAVRSAGFLSVVLANPAAAVIAKAISGDLTGALHGLSGNDETPGHRPSADLDLPALSTLVSSGGFDVVSIEGLGAISSLVPGAVFDGRPGVTQALAELDRRAATRSPYREIAGRLHLLAQRTG